MEQLPSIPPNAMRPLSPDQRRMNLARTLASAPGQGAIRVFAYGSLIWDPCFAFASMETALLDGYRRAFNFWSVMSRGTPGNPGLGLGLERGGSCLGIVYRLADEHMQADLEAIWAREMHSDVYEPRWLRIETAAGACDAIGFVTNTRHSQYASRLSAAVTARITARARGEKGPCREYLAATVASLARYGIDDPALTHLLQLVEAQPPER